MPPLAPPSVRPADATPALALFDCDGTLVDSQRSIVACMTAAWQAMGWPPPPATAVRRQVGLSLETAIARLILADGMAAAGAADRTVPASASASASASTPLVDPATVARMAEAYRVAVRGRRARGEDDDPIYPGIPATLAALDQAGILMGVATGKSLRGLEHTLDRHGLRSSFVTLQTSDRAPGKPDPTMVFRAIADVGGTPEATVVIGDTVFDITMARNAGVAAIGVCWGYHDREELRAAGATCVVEDPNRLTDAILAVLANRQRTQE